MRREEQERRRIRDLGHITQETEDHHSEMKLKPQSITKHTLTKLNNGVGNSLKKTLCDLLRKSFTCWTSNPLANIVPKPWVALLDGISNFGLQMMFPCLYNLTQSGNLTSLRKIESMKLSQCFHVCILQSKIETVPSLSN